MTTTSPGATASSAQVSGATSAVSTSRTTRSPSTSLPTIEPCTARPSPKRTSVVSSRRLWALVSTRPGATTKPLPRPWRPIDTTDGPAASLAVRTRSPSSSMTPMGTPRRRARRRRSILTIELLVTLDSPDAAAQPVVRRARRRRPPHRRPLDAARRRRAARRRPHVRRAGRAGRRHRPDGAHGPAAGAAADVADHRHPLRAPPAAHALLADRAGPAARRRPRPRSPSGAPDGRATARPGSTTPAAPPSRTARGARRASASSPTRRAPTSSGARPASSGRCPGTWWAPPPSKRLGRAIPVRRVRFPSTSATLTRDRRALGDVRAAADRCSSVRGAPWAIAELRVALRTAWVAASRRTSRPARKGATANHTTSAAYWSRPSG